MRLMAWVWQCTQFSSGWTPVFAMLRAPAILLPMVSALRRWRRARLCSSYVPLLPFW